MVVLVLVAGASVSCSDDPYAAYCDVVADSQDELTRILGEGGPDVLLRALPIFRELEDAAPSDIRDDWRIVVTGLAALESAGSGLGGGSCVGCVWRWRWTATAA